MAGFLSKSKSKSVTMFVAITVLWGNLFCPKNSFAKTKDELIYIVKHDCGSCHGMTLKGGLGPSLLSDKLKNVPLDSIIDSISNGRVGTAMPGWKKLLNSEDIKIIAEILKEGEIQK
jgi:cytochrome c55X